MKDWHYREDWANDWTKTKLFTDAVSNFEAESNEKACMRLKTKFHKSKLNEDKPVNKSYYVILVLLTYKSMNIIETKLKLGEREWNFRFF